MGFESFRVDLRPRHVTFAEADTAVRRLPNATSDHAALATPGSSYHVVADGSHVFEIEVTPEPVRVSCRFTLCHPPTVDAAFLDLLRDLTRRLGGAEVGGEGLPAEVESPEFASALSAHIAARRAEWDAAFGNVRFPATTGQAFERYVFPKCVPVAGPAAGVTAAGPAPTVQAPSP
ncbi:MAG: hypothetical protein U0804_21110 [Gemmataceae bacterium]